MDNTTLKIHYEKRKNSELFKSLQKEDLTSLSELQNYIPIYKRFFLLNETNYNSLNLNNSWFLTTVKNGVADNKNLYNCSIQNLETNKTKKICNCY